MIDQAEGRTSVWEYLNPVDVAKFAYFNPLGSAVYGPWRAMAAGRGITLPGVFPVAKRMTPSVLKNFLTAPFKFKEGTTFVTHFNRAKRAGGAIGKAFFSGVEGIGAGGAEGAAEAIAYAAKGGGKELLKMRMANQFKMAGTDSLLGKVLQAKAGPVVMARAGMIWAGRVINPVMNIVLAAQAVRFIGETTFKAVRATAEVINRASERVYNLDLGGELSRGFLTGQAATERQRALQAIQSSHLSGRRSLGNEAGVIAGT